MLGSKCKKLKKPLNKITWIVQASRAWQGNVDLSSASTVRASGSITSRNDMFEVKLYAALLHLPVLVMLVLLLLLLLTATATATACATPTPTTPTPTNTIPIIIGITIMATTTAATADGTATFS